MAKPYYSILNNLRDLVADEIEKRVMKDIQKIHSEMYLRGALDKVLSGGCWDKDVMGYDIMEYRDEILNILELDMDFSEINNRVGFMSAESRI